jgi:hypothetical protein
LAENISNESKPLHQGLGENAPKIWGVALFIWLVALCVVPDPRPLGAPEWSVRALQSAAGLSESMARAAATFALRAVGVGMIGVLAALSLKQVSSRYCAALLLVASPLVALGVKWINFGYFPVMPQFQFIVVVAILGALAGLALRRSRIALTTLVGLAAAIFVWGSSTGVPDDLYEAARATGLHVLENSQEVPEGDGAFERLLEIAFAYAEDNSHGTSAVMPNRAAILALGVILGEDRVAEVGRRTLDPGNKEQRAAVRSLVTLHGRADLPQHFWVSAALTVLSDENRALTVGILKEMKDSTAGGSGFSFVDMAANKAGIRFAVLATRDTASARIIQMRIAEGVSRDHFMADISGLPEAISADAFHSDFGGLGGEETRKLFAEIDRRISACKGFR